MRPEIQILSGATRALQQRTSPLTPHPVCWRFTLTPTAANAAPPRQHPRSRQQQPYARLPNCQLALRSVVGLKPCSNHVYLTKSPRVLRAQPRALRP